MELELGNEAVIVAWFFYFRPVRTVGLDVAWQLGEADMAESNWIRSDQQEWWIIDVSRYYPPGRGFAWVAVPVLRGFGVADMTSAYDLLYDIEVYSVFGLRVHFEVSRP